MHYSGLVLLSLLIITLLVPASSVLAAVKADGVLAVDWSESETFVAVRIDIPQDQALSEVRWVNNDETSQPSIRVVPGTPQDEPDISADGLTFTNLVWESLGWMQAGTSTAITTESRTCFAVFSYPSGVGDVELGVGGGCGVAYRIGTASTQVLISQNGMDWVEIHSSVDVLCEASFVSAVGATTLLNGVGKKAARKAQISEGGIAVDAVQLDPAFPNPFNPSTHLVFSLRQETQVVLAVYDTRGRLVNTLRSDQYPAGEYRVQWDGKNDSGQVVASGVYFARLVASGRQQVQRLVLMK